MKAYTDIEQSKKLVEILPIESADMCYRKGEFTTKYLPELNSYKYASELYAGYIKIIPCWSLAALFSVFPRYIKRNNSISFFSLEKLKTSWVIAYPDEENANYIDCEKPNLVDTCVEMIIKMHERNLL